MNTTAQVKQNIKKSLKQMGDEPLEILKTAKQQVGMESVSSPNTPMNTENNEADVNDMHQDESGLKKQIEISDKQNIEKLGNEIEDIRRKKLFDLLLARIQKGEVVPIENFQELSYEQRDVLKAQLEAVKGRLNQTTEEKPLTEPATKKSRRFGGFGKRKNQAEKQQTRVEMPLPPSG